MRRRIREWLLPLAPPVHSFPLLFVVAPVALLLANAERLCHL